MLTLDGRGAGVSGGSFRGRAVFFVQGKHFSSVSSRYIESLQPHFVQLAEGISGLGILPPTVSTYCTFSLDGFLNTCFPSNMTRGFRESALLVDCEVHGVRRTIYEFTDNRGVRSTASAKYLERVGGVRPHRFS